MNTYSNNYEEKVNNTEIVIYCNEEGIPTGKTAPKLDAHTVDTRMHRAFSVYIFNEKGEFLVTQRAKTKKIWHSVWTNTCCGHLAEGETEIDAIKRRLGFELGMTATDFQEVIPSYTYKTPPYDDIIEHEYCPVYIARAVSQPNPNPNEVEDYKWVSWQKYLDTISQDDNDYTDVHAKDAPKWSWWCKDQTNKMLHHPTIKEYSKQ